MELADDGVAGDGETELSSSGCNEKSQSLLTSAAYS